MTPNEFRRRVAATGMSIDGATAKALRRVLVAGETGYAVHKDTGIDQSALSRARKLLLSVEPSPDCPKCGQPIR